MRKLSRYLNIFMTRNTRKDRKTRKLRTDLWVQATPSRTGCDYVFGNAAVYACKHMLLAVAAGACRTHRSADRPFALERRSISNTSSTRLTATTMASKSDHGSLRYVMGPKPAILATISTVKMYVKAKLACCSVSSNLCAGSECAQDIGCKQSRYCWEGRCKGK